MGHWLYLTHIAFLCHSYISSPIIMRFINFAYQKLIFMEILNNIAPYLAKLIIQSSFLKIINFDLGVSINAYRASQPLRRVFFSMPIILFIRSIHWLDGKVCTHWLDRKFCIHWLGRYTCIHIPKINLKFRNHYPTFCKFFKSFYILC